jgi:hypothetical protein
MPLATILLRRRYALLASPEGYEDGIAQAETISDAGFKKLQDKKAKTKTERHQERKALLNERYGVDVTPELVWKDDDAWYPQLRLHYFLTMGRELGC